MLYRAISLFLLFSFPSLYPAHYVTLVTEGVKNIVIPAVASYVTGKNSYSSRRHYQLLLDRSTENRGVPTGVQRGYNEASKPLPEEDRLSPAYLTNLPRYSMSGMPMYDASGNPTEYYHQELSYRKHQQEKAYEEFRQKQQQEVRVQKERDDAARVQYLQTAAQKIIDDKMKAYEEGKGLHPETESMIRRSKQPKDLQTTKPEENKGDRSGEGNKEPEKDPKNNPQADPTKYRKIKKSDRPHSNPQQDPRKGGMTSKDLKYPERNKPAQYQHQFRMEEGHFQDLGEKEKIFLDRLFDEGVFLGQDATEAFNYVIKCPKTGLQGWMRIRPDGTIIDCGANQVHWGLSEFGFLEKPWDLSGESSTGIKLTIGAILASQSSVEAKSLEERAVEKREQGLPVQREIAKVMDEMANIWESNLPVETKEKLKQERIEELAAKREVVRQLTQHEFDHMQEKVSNARLSKLNPNAMVEITPPSPVIKPAQPSPMVLADVSPPKRERSESYGGGSSSVSTPTYSAPRMSDSKMREIISDSGPRLGSGGFSSGGSMGGIRMGGSSSYLPGTFGNLPTGGSSNSSTHDNDLDDDDDFFGDLLDDEDDDDDNGSTGWA